MLLALAGALSAISASAETFFDEPTPATDTASISGHARLYDFREWHAANQPYPTQDRQDRHDDRGTALGGDIVLRSPTWHGLSAGLSVYSQQALLHYDAENSSLAPHVTHFGEAYARHESSVTRFTVGRQLMYTPFANGDQFTMLPRSFEGISGAASFGGDDVVAQKKQHSGRFDLAVLAPFAFDAKPGAPELKVYAARMTRYESRFASDFDRDNRYSSGLHQVDPSIPTQTPGLFSAGLEYSQGTPAGDLLARLWDYTFFNYARLQFIEAGFQGPSLVAEARPYARVQYIHEAEAGAAYAGRVKATYSGVKIGIRTSAADLALVLERAPRHVGTFRNGGLLHPYSDLSGVLYDDALNSSLEDLGPGRAIGVQFDYSPGKQYTLTTKYVRYLAYYGTNGAFYSYDGPSYFAAKGLVAGQTIPDQSSYELDFGATLHGAALAPNLKAFSISDNLGIRGGFGGARRFFVNRLRLIYSF
ncbi:MAG: hypothetical protein M3Z29_11400 [Pseudomonadota bacterium]|nr:hypothetical protein [Pseudomonadota bacterium]